MKNSELRPSSDSSETVFSSSPIKAAYIRFRQSRLPTLSWRNSGGTASRNFSRKPSYTALRASPSSAAKSCGARSAFEKPSPAMKKATSGLPWRFTPAENSRISARCCRKAESPRPPSCANAS